MQTSDAPAFDASVPALVLKVGHYPLHHGGLAVVRTLGRAGVPVYAVCEDRFAPAGLSRFLAGRFVWPTGGEARYQQQLLRGMAAVAGRIGRPAVLIPTDDHAAIFVAEHAATLREWFLFPLLPAELARTVGDKAALPGLGADVPHGVEITTREALAEFNGPFPVVAKQPPRLLPDGRRTRGTHLIRTRAELAALDVPVLLQEYLPDGEDWLFHGYFTAASECLLAFTGRKLRAFPPGVGETAFGRAERNPELEAQAGAMLGRLGYRGPVSMDYRLSGGRYHLLDLNPRLGAIFRMFTTTTGLDVVRAMHLDLTGRPVDPGEPVDGRQVVVESNDVRSACMLLRSRLIAPRALLGSWRTAHERAWFHGDDPLPAAVMLARSAWPYVRGPEPAPPRFLPGRA